MLLNLLAPYPNLIPNLISLKMYLMQKKFEYTFIE